MFKNVKSIHNYITNIIIIVKYNYKCEMQNLILLD